MIRCSRCGETKPTSEFHRNKAQKSGYANCCKPCMAIVSVPSRRKNYLRHREEYLARRKEQRRADPLKFESKRLVRLYGITSEDRERMIAEQGGNCAICESTLGTRQETHVDHDHVSGRVRSILCIKCNLLLGYARDDEEILMAAIAYLRRSRIKVA